MEINASSNRKRDISDIQVLLNALNKNKGRTKAHNTSGSTAAPKVPGNEPVVFELSWRAKAAMRDEYIEKTLKKGEPLKGISMEEFNEYHYDKTGNHLFGKELEEEYRNAVKGYNNIAAQRQWRYDPDFKIPPQIWNSDEVTADREAAVQKFSTGAQLSDIEKNVMRTFINCGEEAQVMGAARHSREQNIMQATISDMLSCAGIELSPGEELIFSVWGRNVEVSGADNEETNRLIEELFARHSENSEKYGENAVGGVRMSNFYYAVNKDKQRESGFTGMWLKAAVRYLEDAGGDVTVFDLSLDEGGNINGLPEELDSFIKENAKGELLDNINASGAERQTIIKARNMREAFRSAVKTVERGEYERFRNMKCLLTYKNGILETK